MANLKASRRRRLSPTSLVALPTLLTAIALAGGCAGTAAIPATSINQIYATKEGGRVWAANWSNGEARRLESGKRDPYDPLLRARGNGSVTIDGKGVATITGASPRIYVYDEEQTLDWGNVEITVYGRREGESGTLNSQGLVIGGRSEHQNSHVDHCSGQTYYGRLLYDGRVGFQKELVHEAVYSSTRPRNTMADWSGYGGEFPSSEWIGLKFVIFNLDDRSVKLELYRDLSGGRGGGNWRLVAEFVDSGDWTQGELWAAAQAGCPSVPPVFLSPARSVFLRNDRVSSMSYSGFSVREIDPEKRLRL